MEKLGSAFLQGGRTNLALPSSPGRTVKFVAAMANLTLPQDVVACFRRPDLIVEINPSQIDWVADWANAAGKVEATVQLPKDFRLVETKDDLGNVVYQLQKQEEPSWDNPEKRGRGRPRKED